MNMNLDTMPDDLRIRYQRSSRFTVCHPTFPPMFTRPFTLLAYVEEGQVDIGFGAGRHKVLKLRKGDACVCPANIRRHTRSDGCLLLNAAYMFEIHGGMDLLTFAGKPFRLTGQVAESQRILLQELLESETGAESFTPIQKSIRRQKFGYAILDCVLREFSPNPEMLRRRSVFPAIEYIDDKYSEPLDIAALIRRSGVSRTHFFRIFKAQTGKTPVEFLKDRRLREAMLLLQESDLTVGEIACAVGWADQFYFSKIFKKQVGVPPSQYRTMQDNSDYV